VITHRGQLPGRRPPACTARAAHRRDRRPL